ncbi:MAG TPA: endonuclease [Acidimicrobiales bacterium]|nr:endonuclease [Acidimicrobiales bacterium]
MIDPSITDKTEKRYVDSTAQREQQAAAVAAYGPVVAAPPDLVAMRIDHLGPGREVTDLERLIGGNDLVSVRFLSGGVTAAATVGRIGLDGATGVPRGFGTGSLVSPRLLLTNHHVLASAEEAATSVVEFGVEEVGLGQRRPGEAFALQPGALFLTDAELDFTLVAVAPLSVGGHRLDAYGYNLLIEQTGKVLVGEPLNIIQHPDGGAKVVALRENSLLTILDDFLQYRADTNPGSSGAPVYNDQWQLVALHHSGVPRKDAEGRWLARDGRVWSESMGEDAVDWIANEGVRVSRIVARLRAAPLAGEATDLREQALAPTPTSPRPEATIPAPASASTPDAAPDGAIELTVPLRIRLQVLGPEPAPAAPAAPAPVPVPASQPPASIPDDGALRDALIELARATERPYYDPDADGAARTAYYAGLPEDSAAFPGALAELVRATHNTRPHYRPALELYPWVDLQPDLKLTSVYSGQRFDPAKLIAGDLLTEATRAHRLATEADLSPDALEALLPFNCEHVVPQSWFEKHEPQRGDLHHLFTCEMRCNSFRGNIPYNVFDPLEEATMEDCGRRDQIRFQPELGRGTVARATLYMLLRYANQVDWARSDYVPERLPTLLAWHQEHPVSDYERHRNAAIHERQGNRNPFIDHPDWTERLDFTRLVVR